MRRRRLPPIDWERLKTHSLSDRPSKVHIRDLGTPSAAPASLDDVVDQMPDQLAARLFAAGATAFVRRSAMTSR